MTIELSWNWPNSSEIAFCVIWAMQLELKLQFWTLAEAAVAH